MKIISYVIVFSAILLLIMILVLTYFNKRNLIKKINMDINNFQNIISYLSLVLSAIALLVTGSVYIVTYESSDISININTVHGNLWKDENSSEYPELTFYNRRYVYIPYQATTWYLELQNKGNISAENVTIDISFDDVIFLNEPDDYTLSEHLYAQGYQKISHQYDCIKPNEKINMPLIPFEESFSVDYIFQEDGFPKDKIYMQVSIYENQSLVKKFDVPITITKCDEIQDFENPHYDEDFIDENPGLREKIIQDKYEDILRNYSFDIYEGFNFSQSEKLINSNNISSKELEIAYHFFLTKLNKYNPNIRSTSKKLAIYYGRAFYLSLGYNNIDEKINTDILSYANYDNPKSVIY